MSAKPIRVQLSRKKDRRAYTKKWRSSPSRPRAKCHPDRPNRARGLCSSCYQRWLYAHSEKFRKSKAAKIARWTAKNRDRVKQTSRKNKLLKLYGLTTERYSTMFAAQEGLCALCDRSDLPLAVDHDHQTGKVRALLCLPCNGLLGMLEKLRKKEKASWIRRATKYLNAYS